MTTPSGLKRTLQAGEILWHRVWGAPLAKLPVATTLAVLEAGRLGVRENDRPRGTEIFHYVPSMVVGDTAVMNLIDVDDRRRTACVYALDGGAVVRECPPETVRTHVRACDYRLPLALLRSLLAHAAVNFLRLRYRNEKDAIVTYAAKAGLRVVAQQAERISPSRLARCSWADFSRLFTLVYQHREYSREIYKKLSRCLADLGIDAATRAFELLFTRREEDAFPEQVALLVDVRLAEVIDIGTYRGRTPAGG